MTATSPSSLPDWLAGLLVDVPRADGATSAGWPSAGAGTASAGEQAGIDVVHGAANELLAHGAFATELELRVTAAGSRPPLELVGGAVSALLGLGLRLRSVACGVGGVSRLTVAVHGRARIALRAPSAGDDVLALGGGGIVEPEAAWAEQGSRTAAQLPRIVARKSHASVLHHPLIQGQVAALVPVGESLAATLHRVLGTTMDARLRAVLPAAPHRALAPDAAAAAAVCTCGIGMLVFAPPRQANEAMAHIRLWNEPVVHLGSLCAGSGRVDCSGLGWE